MIDPILVFAFIDVESSFVRGAFLNDRNGGSYGLMQIDYSTATDRGFKGNAIDLYAPRTNVAVGVEVLQWLTDELTKNGKYSIDNLAAAYNAGLGHVLSGGTDEAYSTKLLASYASWKAIFGVKT